MCAALLAGFGGTVFADIHYVSPSGGNVFPYTNWNDAATAIQAAISAASDGDTVLVTNGVYKTGQTPLTNSVACRVAVTNAVTVESVNGPAFTVIEGSLFPSSIRCAYVGSNATLRGFSLINGCTDLFATETPRTSGGGVMCEGGTVDRCVIMNNWAVNGGGVLCYNGGLVRNCLIASNSCTSLGGGAFLYYGGQIESCTLVANSSSANGGGVYCKEGGSVRNSILATNTATDSGNNWYNAGTGMAYLYTCASPAPAGPGNMDVDPKFVDASAGNYRLALGSPLIDGGTNQPWMAASLDLDSNARIMNGRTDIGAYEYIYYAITATAGQNGAIAPSGTLLVARLASTNFAMIPDLHYHVSSVVVDSVSIGATNSYTFANVTAPHTIAAFFTIDTFTLEVTTPYGTADPSGTNIYDYGSTVACSVAGSPLQAGATQYVATGWYGTGSVPGSGAGTNVSLTITNDSTLRWVWITNYWLDTETVSNGAVNISDGWQKAGTNLSLLALPGQGHHFVCWTGDVYATNNPLLVTMDRPWSVTAVFSINLYTITPTAGMNGAISPSGAVVVAWGTGTNFVITPDEHYHVLDVLVDGISVGPTNQYAFVNVTNDRTIRAEFEIDHYPLVVFTQHGAAQPSGSNSLPYGTNLVCSILSPDVNGTTQYVATGWYGTGSVPGSGAGTNVSLTITNASSLTWVWTTNYWLDTDAGPDGWVDVTDDWFPAGTNVTIQATASARASFSHWTGDVPPADTNENPLTLTMDRPRRVKANFTVTTRYVSQTGGHVWPYTNWAGAATSIQAAVDAAVEGERVLVSDGWYRVAAQIVITNGIRIESVNGAADTVIDGRGSARCLYLAHSNNVVQGFSIRGGWAPEGGGLLFAAPGLARDCILESNAARDGGAAFLASGAVLRSCFVLGNTAERGGGVFVGAGGRIENCTIIRNRAFAAGGGVYAPSSGTIQNAIIWSNTAPANWNHFVSAGVTAVHNDSIPLLAGANNRTNDPALTPRGRLTRNSACIDAGTSSNAPPTDFDGEARWDYPGRTNVVSTVDIGADELVDADTDGMPDPWEILHFGSTAARDGSGDFDGDGLTDLEEYQNDMSPTTADTDGDGINDRWEALYGFTDWHTADPLEGDEVVPAGTLAGIGTAYGVRVAGGLAYVAAGQAGLEIVSVADPANCVPVGSFDTAGTAYRVSIAGSLAFVADGAAGLQAISVADPTNCALVGGLDTPGTAYDAAIVGAYAYVADGPSGLLVISVADPSNCLAAGGLDTPGTAYAVRVAGPYAYIADGPGGVRVADVSDPSNCFEAAACSAFPDARGLWVTNGWMYVADFSNGLMTARLDSPTNIVPVGAGFAIGAICTAPAAGRLLVGGSWGIDVFDSADPTACVRRAGFATNQPVYDIAEGTGCVCAANGTGGLAVFRVRQRDSDSDALPDSWEERWWGNLSHGPAGDEDSDSVINLGEFVAGLSPTAGDTDADGLGDGDEMNLYFTDPRFADTDSDGAADGFEVGQGTDPTNRYSFPAAISGQVFYTGIQTGAIRVVVSNSASAAWTALADAGPYVISNRHTLTNHWIFAFRDHNGNGIWDSWEASGAYSNNPVYLTNHLAGADLVVTDPVYSYTVSGQPMSLGAPQPFGYGSTGIVSAAVLTNLANPVVFHGGTQYVCAGWIGTGSVPLSGGGTSVVVTVTNNSSIVWQWQPSMYMLTVEWGSNGTVEGASGWVPAGAVVTNSAIPSNGYHFAGWSGDVPPAQTNDQALVLTMDRARRIRAEFEINQYPIASSAGANGIIVPSGIVYVPHGGSTNFEMFPDAHYHVADLTVDGASVGATNRWTFSNVTTSHTIHADFAIDTFDIAASAGPNGSIVPSGVVKVPWNGGTNFAMIPSVGFYVSNVFVDGASVGRVTNYVFSAVTSNHTIHVEFSDAYFLDILTDHGVASPSGTVVARYGTNITASMTTPQLIEGATQYLCIGWAGTGSVPPAGSGTSVVFTVTNNSTLRWLWQTNYWLKAGAGPNGWVDAPAGWQPAGTSVILSAAATSHHHFVCWSGTLYSTENPLNLAMYQAHSVTGYFAIDTYPITVSAGPNGRVEPSGAVLVPYGGSTGFVITADEHYHIQDVVVDGASVGPTSSVVFLNVTNSHTLEVSFAIDMYRLTISTPVGTSWPAAGTNWYGWNTPVSAMILDSPLTAGGTQYVCTGWAGTGSAPTSGVGTDTGFFAITNDSSVSWLWQTRYRLSATNGPNGAVAASNGWYEAGVTGVMVLATASNGYHFAGWTGDATGTNNPLVLTMSRAYSITGTFALNTYAIIATAEPNGTITPSGVTMVAHGGTTNFVIAAYPNYYISNVVVDGAAIGITNRYTFYNVTTTHTIHAQFGASSCVLVVSSRYGSPTPPVGTNRFDWNSVVDAFMAGSPEVNGATQYVCRGWRGTGSVPTAGTDTAVSFAITNTSSITWLWRTNYWLQAAASANGAVSPAEGWYAAGSSVTVTAIADTGYAFAGWAGNVPAADTNRNPLVLAMSQPRSIVANFTITPHYVSPSGSNIWPFMSWATAATTIQEAVNAALPGRTVLVGNGTYVVSEPVTITNGIVVRSLNGSGSTVVDGNRMTRCFWISHSNAVVSGFTIRRGRTSGDGGGVVIDRAGRLENCAVTDNAATNYGGGVYVYLGGIVENCSVSGNSATYGGGIHCSSGGVARGCWISGNSAAYGGGLRLRRGGEAFACVISNNTAAYGGGGAQIVVAGAVSGSVVHGNSGGTYGGGAYLYLGGSMERCEFTKNTAVYGGGAQCEEAGSISQCDIRTNSAVYGGGIRLKAGGWIDRCAISNNSAYAGGGVQVASDGLVMNSLIVWNTASNQAGGVYLYMGGTADCCTVSSNTATNAAGGAVLENGGLMRNCVIRDNMARTNLEWTTVGSGGSFQYCNTVPAPPGAGNSDRPALFADPAAGNWRQAEGSACLDAGLMQPWMNGAADLDGNPRVADGRVDIGAYERPDSDGDGMSDWSEINRYLTDPANPDTDRDGYADWAEVVAGTDPLNAADYFVIESAEIGGGRIMLHWLSATGRWYSVQMSAGLIPVSSWGAASDWVERAGTGGWMSYTGSMPGIRGFYRVGVKMPVP